MENFHALSGVWSFNRESLRETTQNRIVNVVGSVCCAQDNDAGVAICREPIPVRHEFSLKHCHDFVVAAGAFTEEGVDFVDEDNGGLKFARKREDSVRKLITFAEPFIYTC